MEAESETFGNLLKQAREAAKLSRPALADKVARNRQLIYAWEADKHRPRQETYKKLLEVLNPNEDLLRKMNDAFVGLPVPVTTDQLSQEPISSLNTAVDMLTEYGPALRNANNEEIDLDIKKQDIPDSLREDLIFARQRLCEESKALYTNNFNVHQVVLNRPSELTFPDYANILLALFDTRRHEEVEDKSLYELLVLQHRKHRSWIAGNFVLLEQIANGFCAVANESSHHVIKDQAAHLGYYLIGESKRLQIVNAVSSNRMGLLNNAEEAYQISRDLVPDNFRSVRGLGKVYQEQGLYQKASDAYGLALNMARSVQPRQGNWELALHEELRAWRYQIDLIINMDGKTEGLLDQIVECRHKHIENLPMVSKDKEWLNLEYFMAYVYLGGAIAALGIEGIGKDIGRNLLKEALISRIKMLELNPIPMLSQRMRENLRWWASKTELLKDRRADLAVIKLNSILDGGDYQEELVQKLHGVIEPLE